MRYIKEGYIKSKVFSINGLKYREIAMKICQQFALEKEKYYFLYYYDSEEDAISINCQEDFDIFRSSCEEFKV